LASQHVDRVVVSTDSEHYAALARAAGADVPFLRPAALASDTAPSIDFILHAIDTLAAAGERLRLPAAARADFAADRGRPISTRRSRRWRPRRRDADAIVGVSALVSTHPAFAVRVDGDGRIAPFAAPSFGQLPRRQDTEPLYSLDGTLYASSIEALRRERGFCHARTLPYDHAASQVFRSGRLARFYLH
jgi:CMP-N,N'-diacetyllegionaminic acid synthase